ncbi:MAG: Hsp70 family protein, partial [Treponema sp.]|nr:Hsp70 family protein [Treponema sp.]
MAGTIGIKIANGDFYPITGENTPVRKRLVLTTVHDRQGSVQIDLFRSISKSMMDAQYIGSLVVENIRHKPKGEPSIEMVISCDDSGNITAEAYDLDIASGGEHHILNVSLKTMDSAGLDGDFPDFDLESNAPQTPSGLYNYAESKKEERKKFPWLVMVLATLVVVIAIVVLWFFFLGGRDVLFPGRGRPPAIERPSVPAPQETPPPQETPAPRETPPPPEAPPPEAPPPEAQIEPAPPDPAEAVPV